MLSVITGEQYHWGWEGKNVLNRRKPGFQGKDESSEQNQSLTLSKEPLEWEAQTFWNFKGNLLISFEIFCQINTSQNQRAAIIMKP